jgi:uncharacterized protein YgbK (DUF1537 family)
MKKDQLQNILNSGLHFSVSNGKLKIKGNPETIESLKPLLIEYKQRLIDAIETTSPDQPGRDTRRQNNLAPINSKTNAIGGSYEQVTQDQVDDVIQSAVNLAEQLKADRRAADLAELDKAFNTVMHAERTGDDNSFAYALNELEALTREYYQSEERKVA